VTTPPSRGRRKKRRPQEDVGEDADVGALEVEEVEQGRVYPGRVYLCVVCFFSRQIVFGVLSLSGSISLLYFTHLRRLLFRVGRSRTGATDWVFWGDLVGRQRLGSSRPRAWFFAKSAPNQQANPHDASFPRKTPCWALFARCSAWEGNENTESCGRVSLDFTRSHPK